MIGGLLNTSARAEAASQRIFEILDTESEVKEKPDANPLENVSGHVKYEDVSFGYGKTLKVIDRINIDARPGQTIALLGPIGSGKTTVLNLLPRFYDVTEGRLTIDGHDVRDVTLESLRANVGIVMQEVFLFQASIRDNIAYGRPTATDEEIIQASKIARLHDFIMTLPEAYETWVGERGITLSGGQKQRVTLARVLAAAPRVLILDDALSSVDAATEREILDRLRDFFHARTALLVAHRITTVKEADLIVVLDDGGVAEVGSHEALLAAGGVYAELFREEALVEELEAI
jgi:ATP-binding cassette subfamily B protein